MRKSHWLSWFLLYLLTIISTICLLPITQAKATQVTFNAKPMAATANLLLQDETSEQAAVTQNIQMITSLLLSTEDETQQKIFLPIVTR